jgi:hypothetical protein
MKTTTNPFTQEIKNPACVLNNPTAGSPTPASLTFTTAGQPTNASTMLVLFATAGADGAILKAMHVASNDTTARYLGVWIQPGGTGSYFLIGQIAVGALAGVGAGGVTVNIDVLANTYLIGLTYDQAGRPVLPLAAGSKVYVSLATQVTTDKAIWVTGAQEDF